MSSSERSKQLHKCHICGNNFQQYDLEIHFLSCNGDYDDNFKEEEIRNDFNDQEVVLKNDESTIKSNSNPFENADNDCITDDAFDNQDNLIVLWKDVYPPEVDKLTDTKTLHSDRGTSYKCESSSKLFSQAKYLKKHVQNKCEYCSKFFSQAKHLEKHIQTIHKLCQKEHKCKFCDKSFSHVTEQLIGTESPCHVGTLLKEHIQKFHVDIDKKDNDSENLLHHRDPK